MMMKKYASLLFALVLALSLSVSAAADSSGVYVYDDAALLTQEEYDTLNEAAAAVSEQYGCGVYVVTVDDMADYIDPDAVTETGETGMAAFTEYAWDALGLAASYDSNGIMLALSMAEREDRFTHTTEVRTPIKTESDDHDSGPSFSGGTTVNSGGFSHSGGKF